MCLPKANCAKAAETIKLSPEVLGAQPAPGFCSTRRLPYTFILKDQCHHAWLSMGIDDVGDSNPVAC